jgi:cryptochrome
MSQRVDAAIHWFRRGLRLHDNPALVHALKHARRVYPLFVIDPWFADPTRVGVNRYAFMLDTLRDLDNSLRKCGSRLYVVRGKPEVQLPAMVSHWGARLVTYELDTSPYSKRRDEPIAAQLRASQVDVVPFCSHNLHPHEAYVKAGQGVVMPATYASFLKTFEAVGPPRRPLPAVTAADFSSPTLATDGALKQYDVPTLAEMVSCRRFSHVVVILSELRSSSGLWQSRTTVRSLSGRRNRGPATNE